MSSRSFRSKPNSDVTYYPRLQGTNGACATHHNLSAMAARDVLGNGGNAVDAAAPQGANPEYFLPRLLEQTLAWVTSHRPARRCFTWREVLASNRSQHISARL